MTTATDIVEPVALQRQWGAQLTPGAPPIRHAAPPVRADRLHRTSAAPPWMPARPARTVKPRSPLADLPTAEHPMLLEAITQELPAPVTLRADTYEGEELSWFDAEPSLVPAPDRVERPPVVTPVALLTLGLVAVSVATLTVGLLAWSFPL